MNTNSSNNKKSNVIRCYCNVKSICPKTDYCETDTKCFAKHVKVLDKSKEGKEEHRYSYYCGNYAANSFQKDIIEFRDCLVRTSNEADYRFVVDRSPEYCCDDADFCNKELKPIQSVYELDKAYSGEHHDRGNNGLLLISSSNLILMSVALSAIVFLILVIGSLFYIMNRKKKLEKIKFGGGGGGEADLCSKSSEKYPFIQSNDSSGNVVIVDDEKRKKKKPVKCIYIPKRFRVIGKSWKTPIYKQPEDVTTDVDVKPYFLGEKVINSKIFGIPFSAPSSTIGSSSSSSTTNSDHTTTTLPSGTITTTIDSANASSNGITVTTDGETHSDSNQDYCSSFLNTGSGYGNPVVIHRTIARDIRMLDCIGKGRYGQVWKCKWFEDLVAVKTFTTADSKSWDNEINIYLTQCLRDDNILGFIAADNVDRGIYTELWIITDYHENGALYDYLNEKTLTPKQMITMALSMTKGLVHLHRPIIGCKGKLPLAHCDLKTKNILVKSDLTCCIGDLGLAICGDADGNTPAGTDIRIGTKRYMAPEILDRSIDSRSISAYQKTDIYSLSLIFWEMLRRCEYPGVSFDYQLPYYNSVDMNPDDVQMREVVCTKKIRPEVLDVWKTSEIESVNKFANLLEELWPEKPEGRLKALNVKKTLETLKSSFTTIHEHS